MSKSIEEDLQPIINLAAVTIRFPWVISSKKRIANALGLLETGFYFYLLSRDNYPAPGNYPLTTSIVDCQSDLGVGFAEDIPQWFAAPQDECVEDQEQAQKWVYRYYGVVSILDLLRHNEALFRSLYTIRGILMIREGVFGPGTPFNADQKDVEDIVKLLRLLQQEPALIDMPMISKQIERVLGSIEKSDSVEWLSGLKELNSRIRDFLDGQVLLIIPPTKKQHYDTPFCEWGEIPQRFHKASDSIEELEKCYALGRDTATVFHCIGVIQRGLEALARHLKKPINIDVDTWETIIIKIQQGIDEKRQSMPKAKWKQREPFYEEALPDLRSLKNAWRNPTMHFRRTYTPEQASKVRERTKDFMAHLATRLRDR